MLAIEVFTGELSFSEVRHETAILMVPPRAQARGTARRWKLRSYYGNIEVHPEVLHQSPAKRLDIGALVPSSPRGGASILTRGGFRMAPPHFWPPHVGYAGLRQPDI